MCSTWATALADGVPPLPSAAERSALASGADAPSTRPSASASTPATTPRSTPTAPRARRSSSRWPPRRSSSRRSSMRAEHPALYELLAGYYRQDPAALRAMKTPEQAGRTRPAVSGGRDLRPRLVALLAAAGCRAAISPLSSTSTVRRPPSTRRPNSNSSASARRIVSWIRRCIGRAPISGSKPFFARCLRSVSVKVTSTFFSASWLSSCSRNLSTTRRMISSSSARKLTRSRPAGCGTRA